MSELVTFGETMLRLSPPGNERLEGATELEFRAAGAESNVAVAAGRLGTDATWLSKLPDSALGRKVRATLAAHGIGIDVVWSDEGRQGTYYLEQAGAPRGANVIYDREGAAVTTATADELPLDLVRNAEVFYTSGITPALSETLAETTATLLSEAEHTAFDVNYRSKLWSPEEARAMLETLFPDVETLVVAKRDAREVLGSRGTGREIAGDLADEWGFGTVVVTKGADGATAWYDGDLYEQAAFPAETVDPIGTGDAFVGAFLATRIQGESVPTALSYGAATASLKRTIPGDVAAVTRAEVERVRESDTDEISR